MAKRGILIKLSKWLIFTAAVLVILSIIIWNPIPLMIAIFLGIIALAERGAGPNISAALKAYDTTEPSEGEVAVTITSWDMDNHYHARVEEIGHPAWEYEFVPQGWKPAERKYAARIWRAENSSQPLLTAVEDGIMIPRYKPVIPKND